MLPLLRRQNHFCLERYYFCCIYVPKYVMTVLCPKSLQQYVLLCRKGVVTTVPKSDTYTVPTGVSYHSTVPKVDTTYRKALCCSTERRYTVVPKGLASVPTGDTAVPAGTAIVPTGATGVYWNVLLLYRKTLLLCRQALILYPRECACLTKHTQPP